MQLLLFGYAINTTPRDLPTAVLVQETATSPAPSSRRWRTPATSRSRGGCATRPSSTACCSPARCCSASRSRPISSAALRRGDRPALLVAADATDPVASGSALGALDQLVQTALRQRARDPRQRRRRRSRSAPTPATIRPQSSQLNIVPGLLGTILTLTMLIFTALSVTREIERGTMENLLSMPITPLEIMLGKITPYVVIGFLQAATDRRSPACCCSACRSSAASCCSAALTTLFIATNLSIGYTFSTLAQNQLQAMQMAMMFFLPNMLLSGFMFPFAGMPAWAQMGRRGAAAHPLPAHRARRSCSRARRSPTCTTTRSALAVLMLIAMTDRGDAVPADAGLSV